MGKLLNHPVGNSLYDMDFSDSKELSEFGNK